MIKIYRELLGRASIRSAIRAGRPEHDMGHSHFKNPRWTIRGFGSDRHSFAEDWEPMVRARFNGE
jgi:hypothetical protein